MLTSRLTGKTLPVVGGESRKNVLAVKPKFNFIMAHYRVSGLHIMFYIGVSNDTKMAWFPQPGELSFPRCNIARYTLAS